MQLLTKDPSRRLGASEADAAEIKSHLFFKDTNWDDVFHKRIPSPFFPAISSATDTSNFDSEFTSEQPTLTPVHSTLSAQDQGEFAGFSWAFSLAVSVRAPQYSRPSLCSQVDRQLGSIEAGRHASKHF